VTHVDFFKKCPSCGKHFSVHTDKEILLERHEIDQQRYAGTSYAGAGVMSSFGSGTVYGRMIVVKENVPTFEDVFEVEFECGHCHHKWTEKRTVFKKG